MKEYQFFILLSAVHIAPILSWAPNIVLGVVCAVIGVGFTLIDRR
jgi:hypothetical protein